MPDTSLPCGCYVAAILEDGILTPMVWHCPMHAAAPELLEACKALLACEYDSGDGNQFGIKLRQIPRDVADLAHAAIARATATQP
jgi:hypothetical protein